jgi:nucleoside-diphosphate-sugar epimerase
MILVTGGTGLLGGHVLYALLQRYERVAALKRPLASLENIHEIFSFYEPEPDLLMQRIEWREGDLLDRGSLARAMGGISLVVNCAAIVSFDSRDRSRMISNNIDGTRNLALAILDREENDRSGARCLLIHISSTAALGDGPGDDPGWLIDEDTPRDPKRRHNGYSESKYESGKIPAEMGLNFVSLNPGIILGPGQWTKGSSQLFVKAWQGIKYYPYGGMGYVDVRDVADIITLLTHQHETASGGPAFTGQRFCLVGANLRYREFFNLATDEFGKPNPRLYAGRFLSGLAWRTDTLRARISGGNPLLTRETAESAQRISYYSAEKVRNAFGFRFRSIESTVEWVAGCFRSSGLK